MSDYTTFYLFTFLYSLTVSSQHHMLPLMLISPFHIHINHNIIRFVSIFITFSIINIRISRVLRDNIFKKLHIYIL